MSYAGVPLSGQQRPSTGWGTRLIGLILVVLLVALAGGSIYWLQWASQRGLELGYPMPEVHIGTLSSSSFLINQNISFSAQGTGRELTYSWDFGDNTGTAYGPSVEHSYQNNGTYTIKVTATDSLGQTSTDTVSVTVQLPPPTATFTSDEPDGGYDYVHFDASGSYADQHTYVSSYSWDFGDGSSDTTSYSQEYHEYSSSGTYTVTLVVTDGTGQRSSPFAVTIDVY